MHVAQKLQHVHAACFVNEVCLLLKKSTSEPGHFTVTASCTTAGATACRAEAAADTLRRLCTSGCQAKQRYPRLVHQAMGAH